MKSRALLVAVVFVWALIGGTAVWAQTRVIDAISGSSQKMIQLALSEFVKQGLSIDGYRIVVMEVDKHAVVLFEDMTTPTGQRGSSPRKPSFEVELSEDGAKVVRANFVR
jgi:hypothetical protein